MEQFLIGVFAFHELMTIARKCYLLGPAEVTQMTTDYMNIKPHGLQIDWIARNLGIEPSKLQAEFCRESDWTIWPSYRFEIGRTNLDPSFISELRNHGMVPILAEQGQSKTNERSGYIAVLGQHGFLSPMALAICRKHNLQYLFCFVAIVEITELQKLLASSRNEI